MIIADAFLWLHLPNDASSIHVSLHEMPANASVRRQCTFQIDTLARLQITQIGAPHGLGREAHSESSLVQRGHRQASAIHRDAMAHIQIGQLIIKAVQMG